MEAALIEQVKAEIGAGEYIFKATGSNIKFPGFMILISKMMMKKKGKGKQAS